MAMSQHCRKAHCPRLPSVRPLQHDCSAELLRSLMKNWFWKKDATPQQKWVVVILLLFVLGALCAMYTRSFVPSTAWIQASLAISAVLIAGAAYMLRKFYQEGTWYPGGPWLEMSPLKRAFMLPMAVLMLFLFVWMAVSVPLPSLYTRYWGEPAETLSAVKAHKNTGRHGCRYQFKVEAIHYWLFEFCIDQDDYETLEGQSLYAQLQSKQSFFGDRYESLLLTPAPVDAEDALTLEEGAVTIMDGDPNVVTTIELTDPDTGKTRRVVIPPAGSAQ